MIEKIKSFFEKKPKKSSSSPTKENFIQKRDKLAESIKNALLAFFDAISPVWTFLFLGTPDPNKPSNEISQDVIKFR